MAQALNSVFKAELIDRRTWPGLRDVLVATSTWVGWYNNRRVHSALGYRPPRQAHQEHTAAKTPSGLTNNNRTPYTTQGLTCTGCEC
ncbi:integrase core domain-containing protein [Corynebacterium auris]|uniref:integrase core domain-containing protein n=1 Tax=Corynebacterium auris TaxID=44750 RepID=UPI00339008EC